MTKPAGACNASGPLTNPCERHIMAKSDLTAERLRSVVHYDAESGVITRLSCFQRPDVVGKSAHPHRSGYLRMSIDGYRYFAHHLAWLHTTGELPVGEVDHINGNKSDNRWANLREVTSSVNKQNQRRAKSNSQSGLLGVSWDKKREKWVARIKVGEKYLGLGRFEDKLDAWRMYVLAKRRFHSGCTI